ncbi:hypothetical protein ACOSQ3_032939 [Xanthoceras sorbifolium]
MKREFVNLKQRQMTVTEYEREFIKLSKYASEMVTTKENRCRKFEDGLNDYIRLQVVAFKMVDFTRLVSTALNVESVRKDEQARKNWNQQRRGSGQSSSSQPPNCPIRIQGYERRGRRRRKERKGSVGEEKGKGKEKKIQLLFTE